MSREENHIEIKESPSSPSPQAHLNIHPNVCRIENGANILESAAGIVLIVVGTRDGVPQEKVVLHVCEDIGRVALWHGITEHNPGLDAWQCQEKVTEQQGVLFLVASLHLQELVRGGPEIPCKVRKRRGILQHR